MAKGKGPIDVRSFARAHTRSAIKTLAGIMSNSEIDPKVRIQAAEALLNRGWGLPKQDVSVKTDQHVTHEPGAVSDFATWVKEALSEGEGDEAAESVHE